MTVRAKARATYRPAPLTLAPIEVWEAAAVKALEVGEATPEQQKHALNWILKTASGIGLLSFDPANQYATAFNEGKRFIGIQLYSILTEPMDTFKKPTGRQNG